MIALTLAVMRWAAPEPWSILDTVSVVVAIPVGLVAGAILVSLQ